MHVLLYICISIALFSSHSPPFVSLSRYTPPRSFSLSIYIYDLYIYISIFPNKAWSFYVATHCHTNLAFQLAFPGLIPSCEKRSGMRFTPVTRGGGRRRDNWTIFFSYICSQLSLKCLLIEVIFLVDKWHHSSAATLPTEKYIHNENKWLNGPHLGLESLVNVESHHHSKYSTNYNSIVFGQIIHQEKSTLWLPRTFYRRQVNIGSGKSVMSQGDKSHLTVGYIKYIKWFRSRHLKSHRFKPVNTDYK